MKWCIFYGDGSKFTHNDGDVFDAPKVNVQVIVQEWGNACQVKWGTDNYWWQPVYPKTPTAGGYWCAGEDWGKDEAFMYFGACALKKGRTIYDKTRDPFKEIMDRARQLAKEWSED